MITHIETLLKNPLQLIEKIRSDEDRGLMSNFVLLAFIGFLVFGLILGSFSLHEQLWAAPLKVVLGVFGSALICFPSLYIFTALTGAPLKISEIVNGFGACLALFAALLLGFSPVIWVFSQSSDSEAFFGALVLVAWLISFFFGTGFLLKMLTATETEKRGPLKIWIGIFLLVTLQMSTSLRPIIGRADTLFTTEKRSFLEHWGMELFDESVPPRRRSTYEAPGEASNPYLEN